MKQKGMRLTALLAAVMLLPTCYSAAADDAEKTVLQYAEVPVEQFIVSGLAPQAETDLDRAEWYFAEWEDAHYIFLPATADRSHLTVTYTLPEGKKELLLDGETLESGKETARFAEKDSFALTVDGEDCGELRVMQSDIPCAFLELTDYTIAELSETKSNVSAGSAVFFDAAGGIQYQGGIDTFKGRGNSSWFYSVRKPFNIKLSEKADLYGMGKAKKWALLSNWNDQSNLRNAVASVLGQQSGLQYAGDSRFVDIYLNGEYYGTYELAERVEIQSQRVDITNLEKATEKVNEKALSEYPMIIENGTFRGEEVNSYRYYDIPNNPEDITGGYLVQFQMRWRSAAAEFVTSRGHLLEIVEPEYPTQAQVEYFRAFVQDMEDAIYAEDGYNAKGKHYSEYLDVESFAIGYLIQEITENPDGAQTSFYLWKDSDLTGDGKLHYGPPWDFDLAFGNYGIGLKRPDGSMSYSYVTENLYPLYMNLTGYDVNHPERGSEIESILMKLWQKDEYIRLLADLYAERFDAQLIALSDPEQEGGSGIQQMADSIANAMAMHNMRWHMYGVYPYKTLGSYTGKSWEENVEFLRKFVQRRQRYLSTVFVKEVIGRDASAADETIDSALALYDEPEQQVLIAFRAELAERFAETETIPEADALLAEAAPMLDSLPQTELSGDFIVDGEVNVLDAQMLLIFVTDRFTGLNVSATATQERNGDVNKSEMLDSADAQHILLHYTASLAGNDYKLPTR
ncbi:MAG: CotH kinase family protein [Oscillospiraceae bacterium]|nr:CotH kinase family protein [Oscillospiraceae bacterium]